MRSVRVTTFFLLLLIAAFLALGVRCFYLQHFKSEHYVGRCVRQQRSNSPQSPQRGVILDCRGRVLAASNRIQVIFADPKQIKEPKTTSVELAPIVDMGAHEICKLITESKNRRFVKIKVGAEANRCDKAKKISGIGVQSEWVRYYPSRHLMGHIVGFTSGDNRGLEGLELGYDKELRGTVAKNIFVADVLRRPIRLEQQEGVLTNGSGIVLTIDATIQEFTRSALMEQYESYEAESAVAVVAEPKTGAILAMVSLPDFDPADAGSTDPNYFRSRAITDWYEPGSILKPIAMAIGLDAGVVKKQETIFCENGNYHGKGFGRIGEYRRGFGDLSVREILIKSSNIGMAKIGQRLGKERLHNGMKLFGFGRKTGIELPGEVDGLLWPVHKWTGYSVTRVPFGQEICVTAIQLVRAFCILANGGRLVRPHLVRAIVDDSGNVTELKSAAAGTIPLAQVGYVIKPEVARWVVGDAMVGVVNEGTGKRAKLEKWQVFGKTGTANIAKSDGRGYSDSDYVASFVAGAPAEDPAIVVLVSVRKPNKKLGKGYTGGVVASPAAAKIIEKTLTYLEKQER